MIQLHLIVLLILAYSGSHPQEFLMYSHKKPLKKQQQKTLLHTLFTLFQIFPHVSSSWPAETKRKKRLISLFISFTVVKSHGIVMKYESHKTKIVPRRRLHQLSPRLLGLQTAPSSS